MRTIKFRAWDTKKQQMTGFEFAVTSNGSWLTPYFKLPGEFWKRENTSRLVVMQSTHLIDQNNREIYEGDIVKISKIIKEPWIIGWNEAEGRWSFVYDTGEVGRNIVPSEIKRLKVIGNIYENPELLKANDPPSN